MNVVEILFSPTGGTEKVAQIISGRLSDTVTGVDLSDAKTDFSKCEISNQDMALIAMPSFSGRAPAAAIERLKQIDGNGAKCVLVCVYGNREYEDTLAEMEDAAKESGFCVIAAVAAVAEHSVIPQYASGRPDDVDRRRLENFADQIAGKSGAASEIPGNRPYKEAGGVRLVPEFGNACAKCGACAANCPVQAIDTASLISDPEKCISCMRCVKQCPKNARTADEAIVSAAALSIKEACSVRKEAELFV